MSAFENADDLAKQALKSMNNAYISIQSIFDVEKQLNSSKGQYSKYIGSIPSMIANAETSSNRNHVKNSTKFAITEIKKRYSELQTEIADKSVDWIVIGALVMVIVEGCASLISSSTEDIQDYKDEEESTARRKREDDDSNSYSGGGYSSGYSSGGDSGGSGFSGFGGGESGGGGASGAF